MIDIGDGYLQNNKHTIAMRGVLSHCDGKIRQPRSLCYRVLAVSEVRREEACSMRLKLSYSIEKKKQCLEFNSQGVAR